MSQGIVRPQQWIRSLLGMIIIYLLQIQQVLPVKASLSKIQQVAEKIHVALAVDSKSARDGIALAASVVLSAFSPENIIFHGNLSQHQNMPFLHIFHKFVLMYLHTLTNLHAR